MQSHSFLLKIDQPFRQSFPLDFGYPEDTAGGNKKVPDPVGKTGPVIRPFIPAIYCRFQNVPFSGNHDIGSGCRTVEMSDIAFGFIGDLRRAAHHEVRGNSAGVAVGHINNFHPVIAVSFPGSGAGDAYSDEVPFFWNPVNRLPGTVIMFKFSCRFTAVILPAVDRKKNVVLKFQIWHQFQQCCIA